MPSFYPVLSAARVLHARAAPAERVPLQHRTHCNSGREAGQQLLIQPLRLFVREYYRHQIAGRTMERNK